jgi:hypothetical protein
MAEMSLQLRCCGGMRRSGVCAAEAWWADRPVSGYFYDLVGMTKSTMVVVKSTY